MPHRYANKFSLRIDVDTARGMERGLPKILDLLRKLHVRANVYVVMGPDRNFRAMRARLGLPRALYGMTTHGRPRIVARSNPNVVKRLLQEGHFLSPHGWDHQKYSMMKLSHDEKRADFDKAIAEFNHVFGFQPRSYVFPCDLLDDDGVRFAKAHGITLLSYNARSFSELSPFLKDGIFYLPVFPFYDGDMILRGDTPAMLKRLYTSYVDLCLGLECVCSIAVHPCRGGIGTNDEYLRVLEDVVTCATERGFSTLTIDQLAEL